jgi:TonB-like protein
MTLLIPLLFAALGTHAFPAETPVEGYLVDVSCALRNSSKPGFAAGHSRTCLRMPSCADSGYGVLTDDKRFIKFDQSGNEQAKKLLADLTQETGIRVDVNGIVDGDHIAVANLQLVGEAPKPQPRIYGTPNAAPSATPSPDLPQKTLPFIVKGAWASASDSTTPLPEGGSISGSVYTNQYFGLSYPFSSDWYEKTKGPPPSDSGYYVLAQIRPSDTFKGPTKGLILVGAQDLFFSLLPGNDAMELISHTKDRLRPEFKVERQPTEVRIANRSFARFDYVAPAIDLHWYVMATEIRCHMVTFTLASTDTKLLDSLVLELNKITLPTQAGIASGTGGGDSPVCIKDYASGANVVSKVDPVFGEHRFNPVPVRIIIGKDGKVKHVHFISAFPDQAKAVTDVLMQWTFKPCLLNGQPVEVETGIMFGQSPGQQPPAAAAAPAGKPGNQ